MHFGVLCMADSWYLADLKRAAAGDFEISALSFRDLCGSWGESGERFTSATADLSCLDAILVRTMPPGTLEQVVFRMDVLGRLEASGMAVINPARAVEAAVDKCLATARLAAAGLAVPRTRVCQSWEAGLAAFHELGQDVVLKPLFGAEGRGITRLNDEALAERAFRMLAQLGAVLYVQEFVPHVGHDIRVFVLGERLFAMRRSNPLDWRTNVSRGASTEPVDLNDKLAELARRAAGAIGAPLAGVDLLPAEDGRLLVLEVNAVPGWKALARTVRTDIARLVLEFVASRASASR
ncbi:MAG TPA: RimK family alpha-L-glutamate ligase [Pirellulales bacterium]|jgi:RimK family alpha-L-glutamate ligase|nr:RimK family alpha-L-glutamate ligase [Pirellulales bacterium]